MTIEDGLSSFHIYIHWDGVPEYVLPLIDKATKYAWEFPRFEAGDFAAAIVRVLKKCPWQIYLTNNPESIGDISYYYKVWQSKWHLKVDVHDLTGNIK